MSKKTNKKSKELIGMKNFPTFFFISFILIVSILSFKFVPNFIGFADKNNKYEEFVSKRHLLKYFSNYFKEMDYLSKVRNAFNNKFLNYSDHITFKPNTSTRHFTFSKYYLFKKVECNS